MHEGVMLIEAAITIKEEGNVDVLVEVFPVDRRPPLELDLQDGLAIDVAGKEVGPLPVIGQAQAVETVVRQTGGHLLEVAVLLLASIQVVIGHALEHRRSPAGLFRVHPRDYRSTQCHATRATGQR